jgi:endonuclease YncB( thermonuclease family)
LISTHSSARGRLLLQGRRVLVAFACLYVHGALGAEELTGVATRVFDGDSFMMRVIEGPEVEVRLGEIDAPEKGQPYADSARAALRGMILDRRLRIVVLDVDRYDRRVARVYRVADGVDINAELVRRGHVWVYRRHVKDKSLYDLEEAARDKKLGIWALPESDREPPWRWRRAHPPQRNDSPQNADRPVASIIR